MAHGSKKQEETKMNTKTETAKTGSGEQMQAERDRLLAILDSLSRDIYRKGNRQIGAFRHQIENHAYWGDCSDYPSWQDALFCLFRLHENDFSAWFEDVEQKKSQFRSLLRESIDVIERKMKDFPYDFPR
jgi:hypothetical protein